MPQMKPMNWKLLFIFYSMTASLFILYIFFTRPNTHKKMITLTPKAPKTPNFKW